MRSMCIFDHLTDGCNSLRRRTHPSKRRAECTEDTPRKRRRPLPVANGAAGGHAPVGGVGINGFIFQAPGHLGRGRLTDSSSSSSSSDTSCDTSSSDTSSISESASGSSSDSNSDSDSTSSSSFDNLVPRVPRPSKSYEHERKPSQLGYVIPTLLRIYLSAAFVPQACPGATRIWETADP